MLRYSLLVALLGFCFFSTAQPQLEEIEAFGRNPGNLKMYIHSPKGEKDSGKKPLLVALHGCNQNADEIAQRTGWNKLADQQGFYVLYPQQRFWNNASNCFNWFRKKDTRTGNGELASIRSMIAAMLKRYPIDTSRIHLYGLSAGGAIGSVMLAHYPHLFQSGTIYAGAPYYGNMNMFKAFGAMGDPPERSPKEWGELVKAQNPDLLGRYPKLVVLHGNKDRVVDPRNSRALVKQWTWLHGIDAEADSIQKGCQGTSGIERRLHTNGEGEKLVIRYRIAGIGHRLAIDPGDGPRQGGETNIFAKDMDFHSTYWVAGDMGLILKARPTSKGP